MFAEEGANLILGARRQTQLETLAEEIGSNGTAVGVLAGDVQEESYAKALVDLALERFGQLNGAFNNAGTTGVLSPIPDMQSDMWDRVIATNLTSGFYAAKYQIPAMQSFGGGSLVFTSSFVGHTVGLPGMGAYAAAKAGLIGLTQVLAAEHGADNIRFNALLPGGTKTPMAGNDADFLKSVEELHALKRMAEPAEIAQVALFLLSDRSSFVTGSAMLADGGNSISKN